MGLDDVGQVGFFLIYQETLEIRPFHGADNQYLDATGLSWIRAVIMSTVLVPGGFGQTFGQIAHCRLVVDHERATALKCIKQAQQGIDGLVAGFVREISDRLQQGRRRCALAARQARRSLEHEQRTGG